MGGGHECWIHVAHGRFPARGAPRLLMIGCCLAIMLTQSRAQSRVPGQSTCQNMLASAWAIYAYGVGAGRRAVLHDLHSGQAKSPLLNCVRGLAGIVARLGALRARRCGEVGCFPPA